MSRKNVFNSVKMLVIIVFSLIISSIECLGEVKLLVVHFGALVDNESSSADCLSCHDGLVAKQVGFQNCSLPPSANPLGSHPIEVPYPSEWSGNTRLAKQSDIMKSGIRLYEGKVACLTCHDLRLQNREHLLPVTMKGSALCFVCHRI